MARYTWHALGLQMTSTPPQDPTRAAIATLTSVYDAGRARGLSQGELIRSLSAELCRRFGLNRDEFADDNFHSEAFDDIDWAEVSPLAFGALSQLAQSRHARRGSGAHYTGEEEMLALLRPLFLDELDAGLNDATTEAQLLTVVRTLRDFRGLDPAAGGGNFLVIALRELLIRERELLRRLREEHQWSPLRLQAHLDEHAVSLSAFAGIELDEAALSAARLALLATQSRADRSLLEEFGLSATRGQPRLIHANALNFYWDEVWPGVDAVYVFGNPPFLGHKYRTTAQSEELREVWGSHYRKLLDYATGWFLRAAHYARKHGPKARVAFLATNSVGQGEQVAYLWGPLFELGVHLDFVHAPFPWRSSARDAAVVHVMIVGFSHGARPRTLRFAGAELGAYRAVDSLSPYALPGPERVVSKRTTPLSPELSPAVYGSLPSDGGGLIVSASEYPHEDPVASAYLRPFIGARELMKATPRWCLWMPDPPSEDELLASPFLRTRLERVRAFRLSSRNADTRGLASRPHRFFHRSTSSTAFVAFPAQVSRTRRWYTPAYLDAEVVPSNSLYWSEDASGLTFAIVSSSMFAAWLDTVGGKLKSDPRFGSAVYNAFPFPLLRAPARGALAKAGLDLARVRERYPERSLAQLYDSRDPLPELIRAHAKIDALVDAHLEYTGPGEDRHARVRRLLELHRALETDT